MILREDREKRKKDRKRERYRSIHERERGREGKMMMMIACSYVHFTSWLLVIIGLPTFISVLFDKSPQ